MKRRFLALVIMLCMVFCTIPQLVYADSKDPAFITSKGEFKSTATDMHTKDRFIDAGFMVDRENEAFAIRMPDYLKNIVTLDKYQYNGVKTYSTSTATLTNIHEYEFTLKAHSKDINAWKVFYEDTSNEDYLNVKYGFAAPEGAVYYKSYNGDEHQLEGFINGLSSGEGLNDLQGNAKWARVQMPIALATQKAKKIVLAPPIYEGSGNYIVVWYNNNKDIIQVDWAKNTSDLSEFSKIEIQCDGVTKVPASRLKENMEGLSYTYDETKGLITIQYDSIASDTNFVTNGNPDFTYFDPFTIDCPEGYYLTIMEYPNQYTYHKGDPKRTEAIPLTAEKEDLGNGQYVLRDGQLFVEWTSLKNENKKIAEEISFRFEGAPCALLAGGFKPFDSIELSVTDTDLKDSGIDITYDKNNGIFYASVDPGKTHEVDAIKAEFLLPIPDGAVSFTFAMGDGNSVQMKRFVSSFDSTLAGGTREQINTGFPDNKIHMNVFHVRSYKVGDTEVFYTGSTDYRHALYRFFDSEDKVIGTYYITGRAETFNTEIIGDTKSDESAFEKETTPVEKVTVIDKDARDVIVTIFPQKKKSDVDTFNFQLEFGEADNEDSRRVVYLPYSYIGCKNRGEAISKYGNHSVIIGHYTDEMDAEDNMILAEILEGTFEPQGIRFYCKSFSPFTITWNVTGTDLVEALKVAKDYSDYGVENPAPSNYTEPTIHHEEVKETEGYLTCKKDNDCLLSGYNDLDASFWYHDGIHYCIEKQIMDGIADGVFNPSGDTTRGMMMTILARLAGEQVDATGAEWYKDGMTWAVAQGISDGTNPTGNITREQFATMLYRYAQKNGQGFTGSWMFLLDYPDRADVSDWANEAVHWCSMKGILGGYEDGTLKPQGFLSRAEAAAMIQRYCGL